MCHLGVIVIQIDFARRENAMPAVVLFVNLDIADGKVDAFVARAQEHRDNVLTNEPDCQRFDISKSEQNENIVRLYEVYANEAAFKHHLETDYMKAYMNDTGPMIISRERVKAFLQNDP